MLNANLQLFGGRGASAGNGGNKTSSGSTKQTQAKSVNDLIEEWNGATGDYDGDGNQALINWQQMDDADMGHYLHEVFDNVNYDNYDDGYGFYDNSFQKFVLQNNLNNPITVLSDSDFNDYVNATGQPVFYRGWSSQKASDRLVNAKNFHTGTGIYGDGIYMAQGDESTARSYGSYVNAYALSPKARVADLSQIRAKYNTLSLKSQKALSNAGGKRDSSRSYGSNDGESQLALKMGYNVIRVNNYGDGSYYVALTRDALIMRKSKV